jgi:SAM-dependent methyltransferase
MNHERINYSVDLLSRDEQERGHIRRELSAIKQEYEISKCIVLELGCGMGANLDIFREDNEVRGIEGLPDAVAQAQLRGLSVTQGNLENSLNVVSHSADWILCLDVLEHLVNPLPLMLEIRRILRAGGRAVVNVPNHFNFIGRAKLLFGKSLDVHDFFPESHDWDNPHLRFFTYSGIIAMGCAAGLRVLEDRSCNLGGFPKQKALEKLGMKPLLSAIIRRRPSLFAAGFFLILEHDVSAI